MKQIEALNQIFADVLALNDSLRSETEKKRIKREDLTGYKSLLSCFLVQAEYFSKAIKLLIENGLAHEANPIVRSLFELFITAKLILLNKDLAHRYAAFDWVKRKQSLDKNKKYGLWTNSNSRAENTLSEQEIEDGYKRVVDKFNFGKQNYWFQPNPASLYDACILTGDEINYDTVYRQLSNFAHVNIVSLRQFSLEEADGEIVFTYEPSNGYEVLGPTLILLLTISNIFNEEFELGFHKQINDLTNRLLDAGPKNADAKPHKM